MTKGKKRKTPSRIEYEHNHPRASFRVAKELYDKLQAAKEADGKIATGV